MAKYAEDQEQSRQTVKRKLKCLSSTDQEVHRNWNSKKKPKSRSSKGVNYINTYIELNPGGRTFYQRAICTYQSIKLMVYLLSSKLCFFFFYFPMTLALQLARAAIVAITTNAQPYGASKCRMKSAINSAGWLAVGAINPSLHTATSNCRQSVFVAVFISISTKAQEQQKLKPRKKRVSKMVPEVRPIHLSHPSILWAWTWFSNWDSQSRTTSWTLGFSTRSRKE